MKRISHCITALYLALSTPFATAVAQSDIVPSASGFVIESVVIDEVSFSGTTVFNEVDLEKVLELGPGDRPDQKKIVKTAQNLQELYRLHGYEKVRIQTRLNRRTEAKVEHILEFAVSEGLPTRVSRFHLTASDPDWNKKLEALKSRLGVGEGEPFDQEKLGNGYRSLQDAVASQDYMGVKVTQTQVETVTPDRDRFSGSLANTGRWVDVHVHVDLGEKVSFGFQGNTIFTSTELSALVAEQRLLGLSQDYLDRIRTRIEGEYRKLAYERIKIETFTFEKPEGGGRHVTYRIHEGPRVKIQEIRFDGQLVFTEQELQDKFNEKSAPLIERGYFHERDVQHTAEVLVEWMRSRGYLGAKLISVAKTFLGPREDRVAILIYLYEGEQTVIRSMQFQNLTFFSSDEVRAALKNGEGSPLNLFDFNEGLEILKAMYRDKGYLDFKILNEGSGNVVTYSDENRVADIYLDLREGTRYRVSRIDVIGLRKTKAAVVRREMLLKPGDILEERKWIGSETAIRRLGIFASAVVKAEPDPERVDEKILQVVVEEGTPGLIAGGVGIRNDLGGRAFGQISYSNIWGRNHTISLSGSANRRFGDLGAEFCPSEAQRRDEPGKDNCFIEFSTQLSYTWPWALLGDTTFRPTLSYDRTQYREFDATTAGISLALQRELLSKPNLQGILTYTLERVRQYNAAQRVDEQSIRIGSISPALILDLRDNPLLPSRGIYSSASFELARPEFFSQRRPEPVAYSRTQFRIDGFYPLKNDIGTFFSFRTGIEYNFARPPEGLDPASDEFKRYSIPVIKQFALGGAGSLRGFREQGLNEQETAILGSLSYVNYRAQMDFPFAGAMRFGPFVDAANLLVDDYDLTRELRFGIGAGFHYRSPVGPVNFDIGVNPDPRCKDTASGPRCDDEYRLHFSIGTI